MDYRDRVNFFYVYSNVQHPEINNFVAPATLEERLVHIAEAKRMTQSEIPWICDNMEYEIKEALGGAPNGEVVLDPDGKFVRKRFWSDPSTLRPDLEALVAAVDKPTRVEDLKARFRPEPWTIASGVVPRMEMPGRLTPLVVKPRANENESPFYVKLRAEAVRELMQVGSGDLYLGFYVDPIYKVHWNNQMAQVKLEVVSGEAPNFNKARPALADGPAVSEPEISIRDSFWWMPNLLTRTSRWSFGFILLYATTPGLSAFQWPRNSKSG